MAAWNPSRAPTASATGFTLIELLVVLVIAAVAVAVTGVSAQAYMDRARYHQTVLDLATQLTRARGVSREEGRPVVVSWEPQTREVGVDGQPVLEIPPSLLVTSEAVAHVLPGHSVLGTPVFVFNADGRARGGQIQVARGAQGVRFSINWLLGTVRQTTIQAP